jgi:ATP/maltotriose-dependent transcriptional regulator MalT
VVSAPPGSGKTVLLRSWIGGEAALSGRAAWVPVGRGERDPQQFWLLVLGALRQTAPGLELVQPVTAAPNLDGWVIVERLLTDLAPLADRVWLVVDDVHELIADQALRQLELLIMRAPPQLRFVLATRHDAAAGMHLPGLAPLVDRTEGWAAGLRLAAMTPISSAGCVPRTIRNWTPRSPASPQPARSCAGSWTRPGGRSGPRPRARPLPRSSTTTCATGSPRRSPARR